MYYGGEAWVSWGDFDQEKHYTFCDGLNEILLWDETWRT